MLLRNFTARLVVSWVFRGTSLAEFAALTAENSTALGKAQSSKESCTTEVPTCLNQDLGGTQI